MNKLLFIVLFFAGGYVSAQSEIKVGDQAPYFEKQLPGGSILKLSDVRSGSELVLLDFWAGWCKPCIKTIKSTLNPIRAKYKSEQLQIIGISYDKTREKWTKSIDRFEVPWLHVYDADDHVLFKKYKIEIIPTYYLIDKEGKIVAAKVLSTELESVVDSYFQGKN